jgi:hypothetical protein
MHGRSGVKPLPLGPNPFESASGSPDAKEIDRFPSATPESLTAPLVWRDSIPIDAVLVLADGCSNSGEVAFTACLLTEEARTLSAYLRDAIDGAKRSPLLPQAARDRLATMDVAGVLRDPAVAEKLLTQLSTQSFAVYVYAGSQQAAERLSALARSDLFLGRVLADRLGSKNYRIATVVGMQANLKGAVAEARRVVERSQDRQLDPPNVRLAADPLADLALVFAETACRADQDSESEETNKLALIVRPRIAFIKDVFSKTVRTRTKNPIA